MTCDGARELMLEADLSELKGHGESDLAMHIRGCAACAAAVGRIVAAHGELGRALAAVVPARPLNAALVDATRRRTRRRRLAYVASLAAAAALAGIVVVQDRSPQGGLVRPTPAGPAGLDVAAPPGYSVAVFQTSNPDILVIWIF